jgi:Family of unknown function (DUF5640)
MRLLAYGITVTVLTAARASVATAQGTPPVSQPASQAASAAIVPGLVGTWDAVTRSYGGIGSTVVIAKDSVFMQVLGAMVDLKYEVDGDKFMFSAEEGGRKHTETQTLTFVGDTAILSAKNCRIKLTPLEAGTKGSLVGKWRFTHMTGVPAYEEFSADGIARLRIPLQVEKGTYSVTGNTINLHTFAPRSDDWSAQFSLQSDTLTFSDAKGEHRYLRARSLIPLDVQQPAPPARMVC